MDALSVVLPAFNEAENLPAVLAELIPVLEAMEHSYEVVVVDDGSTDATSHVLSELEAEYPRCRGIHCGTHQGKSAALAAGFAATSGHTVVMMDADGQDDPTGIPRLLNLLDGEVGLVSGRRVVRHDRWVKRGTSRLYNWVTARVSGIEGRDFNCGLKVMKRELVERIDLYGELHRYLPILAHGQGFKTAEVEVTHRARLHGQSKYGIARFWRGMFDLLTVLFLVRYGRRPLHLFAGMAAGAALVGSGLLVWMLARAIAGEPTAGQPALLVGVALELCAVLLMGFGLLAELVVNATRRSGASKYPSRP